MSIETQVSDYLAGWGAGAHGQFHSDLFLADHPTFSRGYKDGAKAALAAEEAERERLERCPDCYGTGWFEGRTRVCPSCHGTARRGA